MKVWAFYARPSDVFPNAEDVKETEKNYGANTNILYAMTNDKAYAKSFRSMRNMDIFRETVVDISANEWELLLGENRDCLLEDHKLRTRYREKESASPDQLEYVSIVLTFMEHTDIEDNSDIDAIVINGLLDLITPIGILEDSLLGALFELHYWDILQVILQSDLEISTDLCNWTHVDEQVMEMGHDMFRTLSIDQLEYFVRHYGHTMAVR